MHGVFTWHARSSVYDAQDIWAETPTPRRRGARGRPTHTHALPVASTPDSRASPAVDDSALSWHAWQRAAITVLKPYLRRGANAQPPGPRGPGGKQQHL